MFACGDEEESGKCHGERYPFLLNQCSLGTTGGRADFIGDFLDCLMSSGAYASLFCAIVVCVVEATGRNSQLGT